MLSPVSPSKSPSAGVAWGALGRQLDSQAAQHVKESDSCGIDCNCSTDLILGLATLYDTRKEGREGRKERERRKEGWKEGGKFFK